MRVLIDAGALARFLGHAEAHARAPAELSEDLVIPTLDISPFLIPAAPPAGETATVVRSLGIARKTFADPANGAEFEFTVPVGEAWRMLVLHARLDTDGTVITREAGLFIDPADTNLPLYRDGSGAGAGQGANTVWDFSWGLHTQYTLYASVTRIVRPVPEIWLLPGYHVQSNTANLQAGDSWERVSLLFEKASVA